MGDPREDEFTYFVEEEVLVRFAASTPLQRLRWLEEMRTFTWNAATPETRARWCAARARDRGERDTNT